MKRFSDQIKKAADIILSGGVVAFPTETVYGLGASAYDDNACQSIYHLKGRPLNNPLIIHVLSLHDAEKFAIFSDDAKKLALQLWPGPFTMVLPKRNDTGLSKLVTAGLDTVAIRVPAHHIFRQLLESVHSPIAAPSANKSGYLSPTRYQHVADAFKNDKLFIVQCDDKIQYGLESTIIDVTTDPMTILRHGFITKDVIENISMQGVVYNEASNDHIKAPGMMYKHYSPITPIRINALSVEENEAALNFGDSNLHAKYQLNLSKEADLAIAASNLYSYLHELDNIALQKRLSHIAIAPIPNENIGIAINDRLNRAIG